MSVYHPEPRIVCESRGECVKCGSLDQLAVIDYSDGFYRKECLECGSTGPFRPRARDDAALDLDNGSTRMAREVRAAFGARNV